MVEESISNGRAIVCMYATAMYLYENTYFVSNTAHVFTVANWYSVFSLAVLKRWRFQFVWVNYHSFFNTSARKYICEDDLHYVHFCMEADCSYSIIWHRGQHACCASVLFFHFVSMGSKTFMQIGHCSPYPLIDVSTCLRQG